VRPFVDDVSRCCIGADATIRDVIECINRNALGIVLVVDGQRRLINTITDGDVRRAMLANFDLGAPVDELLARKLESKYPTPLTAPVGTENAELLHMLTQRKLSHIPLIDDDGSVADIALLRVLAGEIDLGLQAVVMAGGFGTRLRPLTQDTPKPMLPVGDRPLLQRTIEQLRDSGINRVNITTHFLPEKITEHFGTGDAFGVHLNYVNEERPLGTAGSLSLLDESEETLLVINGDILTEIDYRAMLEFHREHGADLTVGVRRYEMKVPYGIIESDGVDITGVREKPEMVFFVNAGIYLVEPAVKNHIPTNTQFDMTDLIERLIAGSERVISFPIREYWLDIGQHKDYQKALEDIENKI
jgi:dTDP-glucose pyrophosphorylase/CBS domain-containing protein